MSFDNLIKLQNQQNKDARLPILNISPEGGGFFPLTEKDMNLIRQIVLARLIVMLPAKGIWRRGDSLFDLKNKTELDAIPDNIYKSAFENIDCLIEVTGKRTITGKNGFDIVKPEKQTQRSTENLSAFTANIENSSITKQLCRTHQIPQLVYLNEIPDENENWVRPEFDVPNASAMTQAAGEFSFWLKWMGENFPDQLNFALSVGKEYCFNLELAERGENITRKIHVGIGPNASGKGTIVKMLELIPRMKKGHQFNADDMCEYRSKGVFDPNSNLGICNEYPLDKQPDPGFIGMFKSATRNEPLTVRAVGAASDRIVYKGGILLFSNSDRGKEGALHEAYQYFAEWRAYDRFNICYLDWFYHYPRQKELFRVLNSKDDLGRAFGECVMAWIFENKNVDVPVNTIPAKYKAENSAKARRKYEVLLVNIWAGWRKFLAQIADADPLIGIDIEAQRKIAASIFSPIFDSGRENLKTEFKYIDANGVLVPCFSSQTMTLLVQKAGGNRQWMIPYELDEKVKNGDVVKVAKVVKSALIGKSRERVVLFQGFDDPDFDID